MLATRAEGLVGIGGKVAHQPSGIWAASGSASESPAALNSPKCVVDLTPRRARLVSPECAVVGSTPVTEARPELVAQEAASWVSDQWDPELGLFEWRRLLAEAGWAKPS